MPVMAAISPAGMTCTGATHRGLQACLGFMRQSSELQPGGCDALLLLLCVAPGWIPDLSPVRLLQLICRCFLQHTDHRNLPQYHAVGMLPDCYEGRLPP